MDLRYVLYGFWLLLPGTFFAIALYSKLEQMGGRDKREVVGDYVNQGLFTGACVFISILIDQTVLEGVVDATVGEMVPLGFCRFMLLPLALLFGAKVFGGTTPIRIERQVKPGKNQKKGVNARNRS